MATKSDRSLSVWSGREETFIRRLIDSHRPSLFILEVASILVLVGVLIRLVSDNVVDLPWIPDNRTFVLLGCLTVVGLALSLYRLDKIAEVYQRWPVIAGNNSVRETNSGVPNRKLLAPGFRSVTLWVDSGSTPPSEWRKRARGIAQGYGFSNCEVRFGKNMRTVKLRFWFKSGLLDRPAVIHEPTEIDRQKVAAPVGLDDFGNEVCVRFKNNSGMLIGGLPGSGKTALLNTLLRPLVDDPCFDVTIIDGKGGFDLAGVGRDADLFMRDSEEFEGVLDVLRDAQRQMLDRLNTESDEPNFWNRPLNEDDPVRVLVLDEVQNFLDASGRTKDEKRTIEQISAVIRDLVKRGRSAGVVVILSTQKPTADAIPTNIRDNCGVRICLRVTTDEAAKAVLGAGSAEVSPVDIPAERVGGMVIAKETGETVMARAYYLDD